MKRIVLIGAISMVAVFAIVNAQVVRPGGGIIPPTKLGGGVSPALIGPSGLLYNTDGAAISILESGGSTVNLTTDHSPTDWVAVGSSSFFLNRKASGNYRLSQPIAVAAGQGATSSGSGTCATATCGQSIDWTPSDSTYGVGHTANNPMYLETVNFSASDGEGWTFVVVAEPYVQVLRLYLSVSATTAFTCTASLPDGTTTSTTPLAIGNVRVGVTEKITFRASSIGQFLVVYCRATGVNTGNPTGVTYFAHTLAAT